MNTDYGFFDYKYNIEGFSSEFFSKTHIIFIIFAILSVILLAILGKNIPHKKVTRYLQIMSIAIILLEIIKVSWESYYDIKRGDGFNYGGILPLYTCSLSLYTMVIAAFSKGKIKEICLSWISTIGLMCGLIGIIYLNALNYYPFFSFGGLHSVVFHYNMLFSGVLILASNYKKLTWKDTLISMIPMFILAPFATLANYKFGADYMQIHRGSSVPFMEDLAKYLIDRNLRPVFIITMLLSYIIVSLLVISIYKLITSIKIKEKQVEKKYYVFK